MFEDPDQPAQKRLHKSRRKQEKVFPSERDLCKALVAEHANWSSILKLGPFTEVTLEWQIPIFKGYEGNSRVRGLARVDILCRQEDDSVVIVEAKTAGSPQEVLGGVGQLLHYKTLLREIQGIYVSHMVLATPHCPLFMDKTLEAINAPIAVLHVTADTYFGYRKKAA